MSKQTAVDLFHDGIIDLLRNASVNSNTVAKLWMKCKAMERYQIEDAYMTDSEVEDDAIDDLQEMAEQYYERTYGKEAGNANG